MSLTISDGKTCKVLPNNGTKITKSQVVIVEEQMGIFWLNIGHNERNRVLQERFSTLSWNNQWMI